jgi:amino acid permease
MLVLMDAEMTQRTILFGLAVSCVIIALIYLTLPGGSLPTFFPGYALGSTHVQTLHALAALTAAIFFCLIGLSMRRPD